jgi:predicted nucleic acid-binding OB-fold protein
VPNVERKEMQRVLALMQEEITAFMRTEKMNKKAIKLLESLVVERIKEELKDDKAYEKYLKFISYVEQQDLNESTENV